MRIAFFSDIHANLHALDAVLAHAEKEGVDRRYCLGDVIGYNAFPSECTRRVRDVMDGVILGNHDWAATAGEPKGFNAAARDGVAHSRRRLGEEDAKYYATLESRAVYRVNDLVIETYHGSPEDPLWEYVPPEAGLPLFEKLVRDRPDDAPHVIALGHTHVPMLLHAATGVADPGDIAPARAHTGLAAARRHPVILFNPGSVGQPRDADPRAAYAILDTRELHVRFHRVPYDVEAAADAIREAGLPDVLGRRLFVGR